MVMWHVKTAGSSVAGNESLKPVFLPGNWTIGILLGNGRQAAKCKIILYSLLAHACDKSNCWITISAPLTLYSHPTVDIGSEPSAVEHNLLSCQVHLRLSAADIHLFDEPVKSCRRITHQCWYELCCYTIDFLHCKFTLHTHTVV